MWGAAASSYRLEIEERPGYLHAALRGEEDSFELEMTALTELAAVCRARGVCRLLVEHHIPSRLSTLEVYTIAVQLPKLYQGILVAFVVHQARTAEHPGFLELVARNRGAQGQLFTDPREAEAWLISGGSRVS